MAGLSRLSEYFGDVVFIEPSTATVTETGEEIGLSLWNASSVYEVWKRVVGDNAGESSEDEQEKEQNKKTERQRIKNMRQTLQKSDLQQVKLAYGKGWPEVWADIKGALRMLATIHFNETHRDLGTIIDSVKEHKGGGHRRDKGWTPHGALEECAKAHVSWACAERRLLRTACASALG